MFKNSLESSYILKLLERKGNVDHVDQKAINRNLKAGEFFNENVRGPVVQFDMNAAFARSFNWSKYKTWHAFFSKHRGKVKVYWKELKDETIRKIIEQMLNYVLKPKFESFRKEHESKEKKRKRKRL